MKQSDRLLKLLKMNPNEFISAWDIARKCHILHYTRVIKSLNMYLKKKFNLWKFITNFLKKGKIGLIKLREQEIQD